ncbi:hypothetical protein BC835DRAFT_1528505, partial [Cytidiella melzeri]
MWSLALCILQYAVYLQNLMCAKIDMLRASLRMLLAVTSISSASGVPSAFPASGNGLWYTSTGVSWVQDWLPIGNGYLAGGTSQETTQVNIESLWSGGPFQDKFCILPVTNWNDSDLASFADVEELSTDPGAYGSYAGAGYLVTSVNTSANSQVTGYARWLDLDEALIRTTWTQDDNIFL